MEIFRIKLEEICYESIFKIIKEDFNSDKLFYIKDNLIQWINLTGTTNVDESEQMKKLFPECQSNFYNVKQMWEKNNYNKLSDQDSNIIILE